MSWGMIVVGTISAGVGIYNASKDRKTAEGQAEDAKTQKELTLGIFYTRRHIEIWKKTSRWSARANRS